jgi:hypothetical protein
MLIKYKIEIGEKTPSVIYEDTVHLKDLGLNEEQWKTISANTKLAYMHNWWNRVYKQYYIEELPDQIETNFEGKEDK